MFDAVVGDPRYRPSLAQQELVAAGRLGRKTGRGFFDYAPDQPRPEAATATAGPAPRQVVIEGDLGLAEPLVALLGAQGIPLDRRPGEGYIRLPGASLAPGDGRTARSRVAAGAPPDLVLFDLSPDYALASRIAITTCDPAQATPLHCAAGLFQAIGKTVAIVADSPGLIVLRTLAMLVNEAFEARFTGVATGQDIDLAMRLGANHPVGPVAWGETVGVGRILQALQAIQAATGDPRYRASQALHQMAGAAHSFAKAPAC